MPMGPHAESAQRIRVAIRNAGLSQTEVASRIGVSDVAVNRWLAGWRKPGENNLARLASILGVPSTELTSN